MVTKYIRTCVTCNNKATVLYKPKQGQECRTCMKLSQSVKMMGVNSKKHEDKKRYWHFCPSCANVRESSTIRKTNYCGTCNSKLPKRNKPETIYFDMESMMYKLPIRHFRICKHCGDEKQVRQASLSGIKSCVKCRHLDIDQKKVEEKRKETMKKNSTKVGRKKAEVKKQTRLNNKAIQKIREINKAHRIAEKERKANKKSILVTKSDEDMINEYLSTHKVKDVTREYLDNTREVRIKGY